MKLELKHIAPYLPYGLTVYVDIQQYTGTAKVITMSCEEKGVKVRAENGHIFSVKSDKLKPILYPMDILSPTDIYGIKSTYPNTPNFDYLISDDKVKRYHFKNGLANSFIEHCVIVELLQMHFDVFGLIEQGLAININSLNQEKP
ncbi:hypothetical protein [Pedobacter africanus]|uniref:Uncharacterized protein n=1 Tax=Pedobacter africanus TaxID=151894 RepID=A0A1W1ZCA2_9SPHI|nr:hypothetical protein [Pedobacter africanus]SMC46045.1 hypothetical protein SAMN04488524_0591 [Pedobacter africanus]